MTKKYEKKPRRSYPTPPRSNRDRALARNAEWEKLSPAQQIAALDARLGVGVGAVKQRARLAAAMKAKA